MQWTTDRCQPAQIKETIRVRKNVTWSILVFLKWFTYYWGRDWRSYVYKVNVFISEVGSFIFYFYYFIILLFLLLLSFLLLFKFFFFFFFFPFHIGNRWMLDALFFCDTKSDFAKILFLLPFFRFSTSTYRSHHGHEWLTYSNPLWKKKRAQLYQLLMIVFFFFKKKNK